MWLAISCNATPGTIVHCSSNRLPLTANMWDFLQYTRSRKQVEQQKHLTRLPSREERDKSARTAEKGKTEGSKYSWLPCIRTPALT
ncbi:hypothetical protein AVEN_174810-1 [Araneus ventricosus]|uniref:Uncharacterized protein n=1 Tax=Araneus ventricosus TaxID=182803 RepID=A0A4Y2NZC3_ARAVE|nr:hypothetical protein AVEN_174810-1 [Araneus ventricosus]